MFTVKALQEQIGDLLKAAEAINQTASAEKRDLTDSERAAFVAKMDAVKRIKEVDLPAAESFEQAQAENAKRSGQTFARVDAPQLSAPVVKSAFRYGKLHAFSGPKAEENAYRAGRFLLATLGQHKPSADWCREHGIDTTFRGAMREGSNELGGFIVPEEMERAIIDLREQFGVFRQESKIVPMASDTKHQPRRTGGLTAYFVGENGQITESEKSWDQVSLTAKKLACLTRWSSELNEDALISMADDLAREVAYSFAVREDQCGFIGDGTSTYGGMVGITNAVAAGSVVTAGSGRTSFETLNFADFESCVGKLPEYPGISPKWYISKAGWAASMLRLLDAAGGNTMAMLSAGASGLQFLGYPVVISQVLNKTLGADVSKPKVIFGDLRMSTMLGDRRGISLDTSDQRYFEYDQLAIRGTERFDLNVHDKGTATEAGSVVVLQTAAG